MPENKTISQTVARSAAVMAHRALVAAVERWKAIESDSSHPIGELGNPRSGSHFDGERSILMAHGAATKMERVLSLRITMPV